MLYKSNVFYIIVWNKTIRFNQNTCTNVKKENRKQKKYIKMIKKEKNKKIIPGQKNISKNNI